MEENIIGGVSPLKAKNRGMRRSKSYGKGKRGAGDTRYKRDKWKKPATGGTVSPSPKAPPNPKKPYVIDDKGQVKLNPNITNNTYNVTEGNNYLNQTSNPGKGVKTTKTPGSEKVDPVYGTRKVTKTKDYSKEWKGPKSDKYPDGMPYDIWIKDKKNKEAEKKFVKSQQYEEDETFLISEGKDATEGETTTEEYDIAGPDMYGSIDSSKKNSQNFGFPYNVNAEGAVGKYKLGGYRAMKKNKK